MKTQSGAVLLLVTCVLVTGACQDDAVPPVHLNHELVFPWAKEIKTLSPHSSMPTIGDPTFRWDSTINCKLLFVGVFDTIIETRDGSISNHDRIWWLWHSGMDTRAGKGAVYYTDGGHSLDDSNPYSLHNNKEYYWAVWGWNDAGTEIEYSSKPIKIKTQY